MAHMAAFISFAAVNAIKEAASNRDRSIVINGEQQIFVAC
jgi:hypothetical protein